MIKLISIIKFKIFENIKEKTINYELKFSHNKKSPSKHKQENKKIEQEKKNEEENKNNEEKKEKPKININSITNNNNSHNIYVINNYMKKKKLKKIYQLENGKMEKDMIEKELK